jgi:hypothetical protein
MFKINVMSWSISDENFDSWRSSINNKFGSGKFTVPKQKAALFDYGHIINKGKIRPCSTAQFALTIFWKTK